MGTRTNPRRRVTTFAAAAVAVLATVALPATAGAHQEDKPRQTTGVPEDGYEPDLSPPPCGDAADACIDLSEYQTWLMDDGEVTYGPVPITHGTSGDETPPGTFQVSFKDEDHVSSIYGGPMPYSVFFNGGIAYHEGSLELPSHGCIHLSNEAARTYFAELQPGDVVQVVE